MEGYKEIPCFVPLLHVQDVMALAQPTLAVVGSIYVFSPRHG